MNGLSVGVIIPVGPGHEVYAEEAVQSVRTAWSTSPAPFARLVITTVPDPEGALGRSKARNTGMDTTPTDWHFLLDADDRMVLHAFSRVNLNTAATFGAIMIDGRISRRNRKGIGRSHLIEHGADGTLAMGCFVRGDLGLRFDETLDVGEDFDFYVRLPSFHKHKQPLVDIGGSRPSAGGPRHSRADNWQEECARIIRERYTRTHASAS